MLEGLQPTSDNRNTCKVRTILGLLEEADAKLLRGYLADEATWSSHQLSNALKKREVHVSTNVIIRHRKGNCSC